MAADVQSAKSFGLLVRRYRAVAALTQEELASRAGLSVRAVSDMERGRTRRPFLRSVRQLADALGLAAPERTQLIAAAEPAAGLAVAAEADRADGPGFVLHGLAVPAVRTSGNTSNVRPVCTESDALNLRSRASVLGLSSSQRVGDTDHGAVSEALGDSQAAYHVQRGGEPQPVRAGAALV